MWEIETKPTIWRVTHAAPTIELQVITSSAALSLLQRQGHCGTSISSVALISPISFMLHPHTLLQRALWSLCLLSQISLQF